MANKLYEESSIQDIANAIRTKNGSSDTYTVSEMATAIDNIPSGGGNISDYIETSPSTLSASNTYQNLIKKSPIIDCSNLTDIGGLFSSMSNLVEVEGITNTTNITSIASLFSSDISLIEAPYFDTSNVTNMSSLYYGCTYLVTIPILNTSSVTNFNNAFYNTRRLSNDSLDNMLQMCINATSYTGTKTLYECGCRSNRHPVATIQALPSYNDFINAGWTIGY